MIKGLKSLSTFIAPKVNSALGQLSWPSGFLRDQYRFHGVCVACLGSEAGSGLCSGCEGDLPRNEDCCCCCALPFRSLSVRTGRGLHCAECLRDPPPFRQIIAPLQYRYPVDALIQRYKYGQQRAFAKPLLQQLSEHLKEHLTLSPDDRPDMLLPCPMHSARRRQKGTNHASDIAEHLSRELNIPWATEFLARQRKTRPQQGLSREERLSNLEDAFVVKRKPPAKVAVIDDVVTTGSTVRTLCRRLTDAGARDIQVWALARTPA